MFRIHPTFHLTARRVRIHGLLLAICLWSIYAVDLSSPGLRDRDGLIKGTDFLHFYTLGTLSLRGRGDLLYSMHTQAALIQTFAPGAAGTLYVPLYGPQVSLLFAPLARLPYTSALLVWLLLNAVIYALCVHAVWRCCPYLRPHGWTVLILAIAFPGLFHLLTWGQTSGLALACFTLAFLALRAKRPVLAGLAIGSLIFKPQLGLAAAVLFLLIREWKVVLGAMIAASAQLGIGWWHYGTPVMRNYWHALLQVRDVLALLEPRPYQMHSLRAFWALLVPWPAVAFALYVVSALAALALLLRCWPSRQSLELRYSALLLATILVSPHLTAYDLVILAPAFLLLGNWIVGNPGQRFVPAARLLLYACYLLFLLGPLTRTTHVQLSVVALAALLWIAAKPAAASLSYSPDATLNTP
jgi:alpha-1,2-mannosyltransferase